MPWLWWVTADKRLSQKSRSRIDAARRTQSLFISATSVWEIARKVEKRQLVLDRSLDLWIDLAIDDAQVQVIEFNRTILVESCRLPQPFHGDPADQIIVATARDGAMGLISKDARIRSYPHVLSYW
jgi:PIN domain nuclease of toxin-antitoxin system